LIKESVEEFTGREAESALKKGGKHHNFISIGCRKIFTNGGVPLPHSAVWEEVIHDKFTDFTFICDGCEVTIVGKKFR
jgi:hypothetical protein